MSVSSQYIDEDIASNQLLKIVASQVVFGAPSRTCAGNGICKVYSIHAAARLNIPCELVPARLTVTPTHLSLCISVADCSPALMEKHFSAAQFFMEEDFYLPRNLNRFLPKQCLRVTAGAYAYTRQNGCIWMKLPLTMS